LGFSWAPSVEDWDHGFRHLVEYCTREGHCSVPLDFVTADGFRLGVWVNNARIAQRKGRYSAERVALFAEVPGWRW
jgi:hypothetical protein